MKPQPLVALNHFTVPMLTGVVPSQERYSSSPLSDGLVRSNFWKGRQRLNRLYRWIANVVRPKIDWSILCEAGIQNNPEVHDFLIGPVSQLQQSAAAHRHANVMYVRGLELPFSGGGIGRAAVHRAGRLRPDVRPCGGISVGLFQGHRATFRWSPGRPPAS